MGGESRVTVVTDLFERIAATGEVTEGDLRSAYDRFEQGQLTDAQLERVHRAWVRGDAPAALDAAGDD
ncbi:hypothetical protein [Halosegnis marinus]|uniref:hypothetical protein n=1 Tax=Halosegnis marinus TaxID=3034023 RepID=UPI0036245F65